MIGSVLKSFRQFAKRTDGNVSVEAIIVFPALTVLFAMSWVYFDVMRQQSISQKANYTIGDIISRETEILDESYITNATNLLAGLSKTTLQEVGLRVSVIQYNQGGSGDSYEVIWSKARGDWSAITSAEVNAFGENLPQMANSDQVIVVETKDFYTPDFDIVGLGPFDITTFSFTRPRFAPQVIFEGINDGTGADGDGGDSNPNSSDPD